ncbi:hypothetical protein FJZ39_00840 [Candidatus Saccharibacteria bacterium]|nr:hypothetical protein [Candidatus Saccharibacteria bacterium]
MKHENRSKVQYGGALARGIVFAVFVILALGVIIFHQKIWDTIRYYSYQPSAEIEQIVKTAGLVGDGKFYFYTSQPKLQPAKEFNASCAQHEEQSAILGCYNGLTIAIYDIDDERLSGVKEVTAAHEMLHAAWDRLSADEQKRLSEQLEAVYEQHKTDKLEERMEYYARTQPGERANELHSILGTELREISPELEQYYAKYFNDRQQVVNLFYQYESVFEEVTNRLQTLSQTLTGQAASINQKTADYNAQAATLMRDIEQFNLRAQRGEFDSQSQFNAERARLVTRSEALESSRRSLEIEQQAYNATVEEYNQTADESNQLNKILNSQLSEAPAI